VASYAIARRANEIGIRMALGADRRDILAMVLRGTLAQVALGLAIGIPIAVAGGRLLSAQLYGVKSQDSMILGLAVVILAASACLAGFVPARRATRVDPMAALRHE
jgi:ABC-type antimicrobial peptide transport system permease subunit